MEPTRSSISQPCWAHRDPLGRIRLRIHDNRLTGALITFLPSPSSICDMYVVILSHSTSGMGARIEDGAYAQRRKGYLKEFPSIQKEPPLVAQNLRPGGHGSRVQACQEGAHPIPGNYCVSFLPIPSWKAD